MGAPGSVTVPGLAERYNALLADAIDLNFLVRDADLQQRTADDLEAFRVLVRHVKNQAIERECDADANCLFLFQCVISSFRCALLMWIELKGGRPEAAWHHLVDAQEYASIALRVPLQGAWGIDRHAERLVEVERVVFPGWPRFLSPGIVEDGGDCSICGRNYAECAHVEGLVYAGRLCDRVNRTIIEGNHVALVESPRDRHCIIRYVSTDDGSKKDYITGKVLEERFDGYDGGESHLRAEAIILSLKRLDLE
jgi:hypothetical protein